MPSPIHIGKYPTPVSRADALSTDRVALWVKNDGLSAEPYGGNKVRKLELLLADAREKQAKRIVTAGAGGSHHVLATALYAHRIGVPTFAVLCPQPWTEHAESTLRASLGAGLDYRAVGSMAEVPIGIARELGRGDYLILPGGSTKLSTGGYVNAMHELAEQVKRGELPEPDEIVAAVGSGGTVGGILAGVVEAGLRARVVGVSIATPAWLARRLVLAFARSALARKSRKGIQHRLEIDDSELGKGYGHATETGDRATSAAERVGLTLDPTYTAKAFAHVRSRIERAPRETVILYVHTLSQAPLEPLLTSAPPLGPDEQRLFPRPKSEKTTQVR